MQILKYFASIQEAIIKHLDDDRLTVSAFNFHVLTFSYRVNGVSGYHFCSLDYYFGDQLVIVSPEYPSHGANALPIEGSFQLQLSDPEFFAKLKKLIYDMLKSKFGVDNNKIYLEENGIHVIGH